MSLTRQARVPFAMNWAESRFLSWPSRRAVGETVVTSCPTLGGIPCPRTFAANGAVVPVTMDGSDALCLDGQQVVDISGHGYFTIQRQS